MPVHLTHPRTPLKRGIALAGLLLAIKEKAVTSDKPNLGINKPVKKNGETPGEKTINDHQHYSFPCYDMPCGAGINQSYVSDFKGMPNPSVLIPATG